ncbi:tRNA pseudouridine synthase B [Hasllibacter halocynthiae]|uniref:tRNA pseudouridine synthase B n=1 Tax=Hasllibacter halocynthiae TaxID=595589 RepID=A0A2T0X1H7_9RHOB|nr:tRNA pseudouridine(55) synthase TruB [Hasllibacter halocynthiae]PRY92745.1 tRNA pseudouridine synthase B [Hasllibacter halocynthiae]
MARRRKGDDISGWVVIDKPAGPSSNAVVGAVRRALDARKAGHAGTLDPAATGLLAVALGEATKTVPALMNAPKTYRFAVRLGAATTTDDAEGEVTATSAARPGDAAIRAALPALTGEVMQAPPAFSAVKVDGRRAYAVARAGGEVAPAPRPLTVHALTLEERPDPDTAILSMTCGKGGYVRAVARDLGAMLGCHGHALWLRRTATGPWAEGDAVPLAGVGRADLRPLEEALAGRPRIDVDEAAAAALRHGRPVPSPGPDVHGGWAAGPGGSAVALVRREHGVLHAGRVIAPGGAAA